MEDRLLTIAKRFWPEIETMSGSDRTSGVFDVVGFLYSAPMALGGLVWLIAVTDLVLIRTEWPMLVLLFISFAMYFAWAFFEPQLLFYVFDDLGWTTAQFGMAAGGYGLASALGQTTLGRVGDRFGRKPSIVIGLILFSAQFAGLIFTNSMELVLLSFAVGGLGEGLMSPALGAFFLDISEEQHIAWVMGIKSSVGSLDGVVGPLLAAASVAPQSAFAASVAVVLFGVLLALVVLREPRQLAQKTDMMREIPNQRVMAVRDSLRGIVTLAIHRRDSGRA